MAKRRYKYGKKHGRRRVRKYKVMGIILTRKKK